MQNPIKRVFRLIKKTEANPLDPLLIAGNLKIPVTTAIFNMSSAHDCPSRKLGLCKAVVDGKCVCYAMRAENAMRPDVLPFRRKQNKFWKKISAEKFACLFLAENFCKDKPFDSLRFNEAGDFLGQESIEKADKIAGILKPFGIATYCYTSRSDLNYRKVRNIVVSGSGFKKEGISNVFKIIKKKKDKLKGFGICPMDCSGCKRCQTRGLNTCVVKH